MNDLERYFNQNRSRRISKWKHYFDVYDRYLSRFRNKEIIVVEIGVWQGGSLGMWKDYFGPKAKIFGVDIDPKCKELENENATILIGSQADRKFLRQLRREIPPFDILIDDGGHTMEQQIVTFEELFEHVKEEGVYIYAWHSEQCSLQVNEFCRTVDSLHYYDSMLVIEKRKRETPTTVVSGHMVQGEVTFDNSQIKRNKIREKLSRLAGKMLQFMRLPAPGKWARRRLRDRLR
jgi:hypothetical protein